MADKIITLAEAKSQGLTRYFTGKPCKNGHISERNVNNSGCVACRTDIEKRYRANNRETFVQNRRKTEAKYRQSHPEKMREKNRRHWANATEEQWKAKRVVQKRYYEGHKKEHHARVDVWRKANPDKVSFYNQRWRDANRERKLASIKAWHTRHRDKPEYKEANLLRSLQWAKNNPEGKRRQIQIRRARKANAEGSYTIEEVTALLEAQNFNCFYCSADIKQNGTIDHIIPLSRGGSNYIANLRWLCKSCNSKKHDKTHEEFLEWLSNESAKLSEASGLRLSGTG